MPGPAAFVVLAGGSGSRVGATVNKAYLPLAGRAAVCWSFRAAARVPQVGPLLLVARGPDLDLAREVLARELPDLAVEVVAGGASRHASEQAGLQAVADRVRAGRVRLVAFHDAARPLVTPDLIARVLAEAERVGGALPALPAEGLLRARDGGLLPGGGRDLVRVQTPQAFRAAELLAAFAAAAVAGAEGTDTAWTVERYGSLPVGAVAGDAENLKITYPDDVQLAARLLAARLLAARD